MWAPTGPKAIRTVQKVLLVDRFQQHRHRPLDDLVLERWHTNRALTSVILLDPDALHGRRLIASAPQTLMQVAQVLLEVLGILLGRDPIDSRGARLARLAVCLAQKVLVDEMREGRKHPFGIV